jgi:hypothetical protein
MKSWAVAATISCTAVLATTPLTARVGKASSMVADGDDDGVEYSLESGGVTINLSGVTQNVSGYLLADGRVLHADGVTEDTLTSIEDVHGTRFADVFYGGSGYRSFKGLEGNDTIVGGTDPIPGSASRTGRGPWE